MERKLLISVLQQNLRFARADSEKLKGEKKTNSVYTSVQGYARLMSGEDRT